MKRFPNTSSPYLPRLIIIGILLLASGVRFHLLGAQSLWHDEGNSYVQATRSFSAIAENAARDIHPPGYYWALSLWHGLTGDSEFALRALSAFASILSVAFTYALGVRLFGHMAALTAAALVALNTFSIFYAQETRMYALLALWGVASVWALAGYVDATRGFVLLTPLTPNPSLSDYGGERLTISQRTAMIRWAVALGVFNAAGLWTQYAFPFVMIAQGIAFVGWLWFLLRRGTAFFALLPIFGYYVTANVLAITLYLPWLATAWTQVTTWPNTGDPIPTANAISIILGYFGFGITVEGGTTIAVAFFLLFAVLPRPDEQEKTISARYQRWAVLMPIIWVLATVGAFLILELFREANLKFLLPTQIAFALWVGRGVHVLWDLEVKHPATVQRVIPKVAAVFGVFVILVQLWLGLNPLYHDEAYQRDDYRTMVDLITTNLGADDAVILNAPNQQEVFDYYYTGDTPVYPVPRGLGGDDTATLEETHTIIAQSGQIYALLWATAERDPNGIVENTLDTEAFEVDSTWYGDVRLVRYATPTNIDLQPSNIQFGDHITLERYGLNATRLTPGDVLQVQLEWSTDAPIGIPYKIFVQMLNPDGVLVAQRDSEPAGGRFPMTVWQPNTPVTDNHALIVPNDLPSANYALIIGIYNPYDPQERVSVVNENFLQLSEITIQNSN